MQTRHPTFTQAARFWLTLGWINFGGPAGQIAIMHRELVERRGWIEEQRFLHALNYCMLLPGPEAMQLAIYIGWLLHRTRGALVAGIGFFLPAVLILLLLSWLYARYGDLGPIAGVLAGFKPVVVTIVLFAVFTVGRRALRRPEHFLLAATAFIAIQFANVPFPLIVLGAFAVGVLLSAIRRAEPGSGAARQASESSAASVAGDPNSAGGLPDEREMTGTPGWRLARLLGLWLVLTLVPFLLLAGVQVPALLQPLYAFFTKAAFLTFGGAYAVLAYVNQAAVEQFGWLSAAQAVDGFALAETTPGPLIMVLQFVGFMAGWNTYEPWTPAAAAVTAALLTTYATFVPSFFFILIGAPHIERLRGVRWLDAAMAAVTAAVVGVILNLGVVFGTAVLFPRREWSVFAVVVALLAAGALWRKLNVSWVVLGGGGVGLLAYLFGWN